MSFLSDEQIEAAKKQTNYTDMPSHDHPDCIRIAYEWLDAQKNIEGDIPVFLSLKSIIRKWGGRYVSQTDIDVAAHMHPRIKGEYPHYNIDAQLTFPDRSRLEGIDEAGKHPQLFLWPINESYTRNE